MISQTAPMHNTFYYTSTVVQSVIMIPFTTCRVAWEAKMQ